jgi:hypothetical protein
MYISAFLLGGILCALFQVFMMFTKLDVPRVLILGFALGALLTPYGMMDGLGQWGGAGLVIMVMSAGNAVAGATMALLGGNPVPIILVLGIFVSLTLIGLAAGFLRSIVAKSAVEAVHNEQAAP